MPRHAFKETHNPASSDISTTNVTREDLLSLIYPSAELHHRDVEALLFVINEQMCTACGTEREALQAFAERHPETQFGIVYVEFQ